MLNVDGSFPPGVVEDSVSHREAKSAVDTLVCPSNKRALRPRASGRRASKP